MAATDDVTAVDEKRMKLLTPLVKEEEKITEEAKGDDSVAMPKQFDLKRRVAKIQFDHDVELVQKIAVRKDLTTEDKALFDSPAQSEFWRKQDLGEIRRFLTYFRGLLS